MFSGNNHPMSVCRTCCSDPCKDYCDGDGNGKHKQRKRSRSRDHNEDQNYARRPMFESPPPMANQPTLNTALANFLQQQNQPIHQQPSQFQQAEHQQRTPTILKSEHRYS